MLQHLSGFGPGCTTQGHEAIQGRLLEHVMSRAQLGTVEEHRGYYGQVQHVVSNGHTDPMARLQVQAA